MLANLKSKAIAIATVLVGLTSALPTDPSDGLSTTTTTPTLRNTPNPAAATYSRQVRVGSKITAITPGTAVTGLHLTNPSRSGMVALSTGGYATEISRTSGGLGFFDECHEWWLNIGICSNTWKPLSFGFDNKQSFNWVWGLGSLLTATETTSYTTTNWFIACQENGIWVLYLQTGSEVSDGVTCVSTQLQLVGSGATTLTTTTKPPTTTTPKPPANSPTTAV